MSYRPEIKSDANGTTQDLPIDAETVQGKTPVFTTTNQIIEGVKTYTDIQTFKGGITLYAESGDSPRLTFQRGTLIDNYNDWSIYGGSDGYLYIQKSGGAGYETRAKFTTTGVEFVGTIKENGTHLEDKYAPINYIPSSIIDYGDTNNTIKIGYRGNGLTASQIAYIAGYSVDDPNNPNEHKIKDISKDVLKTWLGSEVATGTFSSSTTLNLSAYTYLWIVLPTSNTANTFSFKIGSASYTCYHFALIKSGQPGVIRRFSNATTLSIVTASSITFSEEVDYVRFKIE